MKEITDEQKNNIKKLAVQKIRTTNLLEYIEDRFDVKSINDLSYEQAVAVLWYLEFRFTDFDDF